MELDPEITFHTKRCIQTISKDVFDAKNELDNLMEKPLKWYDEMKSMLKEKLLKVKNSSKKHIVPPVMLTQTSDESVTKGPPVSVDDINIGEGLINIGNESISYRTRGALKKALQSSILPSNVSCSLTESQNPRGLRRVRRTKQDDTTIVKGATQGNTLGLDSISKTIKKEKLSLIETQTQCEEEEIFKKPKLQTRKHKKTKQSVSVKGVTIELAIEESVTFNAVLHSSPNANGGENTFLVSPKNISVIPKSPRTCQASAGNLSPKEEVERPMIASSTSNDFINDTEATTTTFGNELTGEAPFGRNRNKKNRSKRSRGKNSERISENFNEVIEKKNSSKSQIVIDDEKIEKIGLLSAESADSRSSCKNAELLGKGSGAKEIEKNTVAKELHKKTNGENVVVVDSCESNPAASLVKSPVSHVKSGRNIRETKSVKAVLEEESSNVKPDAVPLEDMNGTILVPRANTRTKPVLKSRILDSKGNILPSVNEEKKSMTTNSPGKSYSLRSSSVTREIVVKKENTSDAKKSMEIKQSCERRSNIENEPDAKRTKRTKAKKTEKTVDDSSDTARITRTKSKEAKEALEKADRKKSGLIEFARKSLNKAKLISLQKDQPKIKQPLANLLAHHKLQNQISASKLQSASKVDLLGSSNKLNTLPLNNVIVNLGSHIKMPKGQCLRGNENLISTGKGKYQNLFTDSKDKFITPAKRCLSPDVMIKSTSKTTEEEELEKELKLKALKEKEDEAQMKREMAIKMRQKKLKEMNEKKLELAAKQRKKLEMEKYNCKIQSEKEKEEKRKQLLQEREIMKKEKARLKKEMMKQKLADTEERRRVEEEARIAKLREQEAEQQRIQLEKQKELERHEKRAQERLAEQKARENYEMKLKTEQMLREKQQQLAAQVQSANKAAMAKGNHVKQWNYKPRNENDCGLEDEETDPESDNEKAETESSRPVPQWALRVLTKENTVKCYVKIEAMMMYMKCHQKTPDIQKMFKMTPTKRIKRTSSAIWNTPSS